MGLRPFPYNSVKTFLWGKEIIKENHLDPNNPFRWSKVVLSLPVNPSYDTQQSKVANYFATYYDDIWLADNSEEMCATVLRCLSTLSTFFGQQEALMKRKPPSPGEDQAWAGAIFQIIAREWLAICIDVAHAGVPAAFDRKELKSGRGFLIHIGRTYPMIVPFLKGVHLMLDLWCPGCDEEGWKTKEALDAIETNYWEAIYHSEEAPEVVYGVPCLEQDLRALAALGELDTPPPCLVRDCAIDQLSPVHRVSDIKLIFGAKKVASNSSNYRDMRNLVEALEAEGLHSCLKGKEVYLFGDNSMEEATYYWGSSSSKLLHELAL
eukprot:3074901-Ditylum_brightwellii.AAC.2